MFPIKDYDGAIPLDAPLHIVERAHCDTQSYSST